MKRYQSSAYQLICLLSRIEISESEKKLVKNLVPEIIDWDDFYELAEHNRHAPFIYKSLEKLGLTNFVNQKAQDKFNQAISKINAINQARLDEAKKFIKLCKEYSVKIVILKGMYFARAFYHDDFYKRMNDLDYLIPKEDLNKIFKIFENLNYFSAGELLGKDAREHDEFSHHLPPFFSRNLNLMLGTHWELHTPMRPYRLDYKTLWSRVIEYNFLGENVWALSEVDNLHHLCVHLSPFKAGARELADITNLVRAFKDSFRWDLFLEEVHHAKSYDPVYFALSLAQVFDPMPELQYLIEKISPYASDHVKKKRSKFKDIETVLLSRSGHITMVDKAFTNFKSTKKPSEKIKFYFEMWGHILFPPQDECHRLCQNFENDSFNKLIVRFKAPLKVMDQLCEDLGTKIFFLLIVYTYYKAITSIQYLFKPNDKIEDQAYFAKKLGLSVQELKELQARLE